MELSQKAPFCTLLRGPSLPGGKVDRACIVRCGERLQNGTLSVDNVNIKVCSVIQVHLVVNKASYKNQLVFSSSICAI